MQVMQEFTTRFRGQVPEQVMAAFRALFKLDDLVALEVDRALLAVVDMEAGDGAKGNDQA
jgi:hypothetical protein